MACPTPQEIEMREFMDRLKDHGSIESYTIDVAEDGETKITFVTPVPVDYIKLTVDIGKEIGETF